MSSEEPVVDRFRRQADLVPRQKAFQTECLVIGVGAVGRQVALMLAAIGVRKLTLLDFDKVDHSNLTTQGYSRQQLGQLKVEALREEILSRYDDVEVAAIADEFRPKYRIWGGIFCCVDSIEARSRIWQQVSAEMKFWADTRMVGEQLRVLTATGGHLESLEAYQGTLFATEETEPGRCTAASTIYTASIAAGMAVHQFTRWLRGQDTDHDMILNLLAGLLINMTAEAQPA